MKKVHKLEDHLQRHFNYTSFFTGQKEIIEDILKGKDVLGILPTGSGKSLCYQLPAKMVHGTTIVISPLISLMIDQVKQLKAIQFKEVIALNSFIPPEKRKKYYQKLHTYKLIYLSPELLQHVEVIASLKKIHINFFVIDEAHCISQWGHEFRPDYLKMANVISELNDPPVLALSATATEEIQQDIITSLNRPNMVKHVYPMDKENIIFAVETVQKEEEKNNQLLHALEKYPVPTIIYFSSRQKAEQTARMISSHFANRRVAYYHGGMEQTDRILVQQQFMNDQIDIICCTSAFGMGINKKNIRLVIHYHIPQQIESFIQEVGRAGRDGKESVSLMFYCPNDEQLHIQLIENDFPTENEINAIFQKLYELRLSKTFNFRTLENVIKTSQIEEVHWRFLHYQMESHGIINSNTIQYDDTLWKNAYEDIHEFIHSRKLLKQKKLNEMVFWVQEKDCLRKQLYIKFQKKIKKPITFCCGNCDFSLNDWNVTKTVQTDENIESWEYQLKRILQIGAKHETS